MGMFRVWKTYCDTCRHDGPVGHDKRWTKKELRRLGWRIRYGASPSGRKNEGLTCPDCLAKEREEQAGVVEKIKQMKAEFHPLTSGAMRQSNPTQGRLSGAFPERHGG